MLARFCPSCGHATEPFVQEGRPRARCPACKLVDYANPKPAVGALVSRGGKVLLSRRAREPHKGLWDLPGGFLEGGERPEDGIRRELKEETGLDARVVGLVAVAPGTYQTWSTLNLVYECEVDGEPRASDDSAELSWFAPGEAPRLAFPHEEEALRRWLQARA